MSASKKDESTAEGQIFSMADIFYKHLPLAGGASALAFSLNVMNPALFHRLFSPNEMVIANSLWFNAHLGIGLYLYGSKHMRKAPIYYRVLFSVFGAVLFNFGSVLFWATTKSLLLKNEIFRCLFGLSSGAILLFIGKEYVQHLDKSIDDEID